MNLSVGIVGFPNAGKSTLFNVLLGQQVADTAPYAFSTVQPNVGVVEVPDERLDKIASIIDPKKKIPAAVKFVDIAGLVEGAHKGEGLGNQFLSHIRETDVICFVLRAFKNMDVEAKGASPEKDLQDLKVELILKDTETLEKAEFETKDIKERDKKKKMKNNILDQLNKGIMVKDMKLNDEEKELITDLNLLTAKPYIVVVNVNEADLDKEIEIGLDIEAPIINLCAKLEEELVELNEQERKDYQEALGMKSSGLEKLIKTAYEYLGLISFFTTKSLELRAWTVKKGSSVQQAGAVIHSDFEKYFVKAKVVDWQKFIDLGGWEKVREKGAARLVGKEYIVKDGDIIEYMIGK